MTFYCAPISRRIALFALFAAACIGQTTPVSWSVAAGRPDLFLKVEFPVKSAPQSILLIGENHASIKTQKQLCELLDVLYREKAIDAILVEGSNGPISAQELRRNLTSLGHKSTEQFWRGELDFGQIAGYEYVALTRDGVRVHGVEDMGAKRRYTADAARRGVESGLQEQLDLHTRAIGLARHAIAGVESSSSKRTETERVLSAYVAKVAEFRSLVDKAGSEYASAQSDYVEAIERITELYAKVRRILPAYQEAAKLAEPYNKLVETAKRVTAGEPLPSGVDPVKFLSDLEAAKNRLEKASAALEAASKRAGYADGAAVVADLKEINAIEAKIKSAQAKETKHGEAFGKLEDALTDQFFLAANAVRVILGRPIPALQTLLRDERDKLRRTGNDSEKPHLSDRDKYMVSNTMTFLNLNPSVKNVVLIIGYAHLEGMTKRLSAEHVAVLGGKVAASEEETEAWENRAWQRRSRPFSPIFSRTTRKELPRLLDESFVTEVPALLAALEAVSQSRTAGIALGKTKIFETLNGQTRRRVVVTTGADALKANWGSHIVHMGALPDGDATPYLVIDRDIASAQTKTLTSDDTVFATMYRTKTPGGLKTRLDTPTGSIDLEDFKGKVPQNGQRVPRRFVIAPEGDEKVFNTALGSGGRGGEPPWTSRRSLFSEPPDGKRPSILFTKNMLLASERIKALEKQDPLKIGAITTIELGFGNSDSGQSLNDLWFTPDTGEHARAYFIIGDNTPEFRARLKEASEAGLLRNKQIALGTCFDENESNAINDMLLEGGALMVWSPGKRITQEAARKLQSYMEKLDAGAPVRGLDEYIDGSLRRWHTEALLSGNPDPDIDQFLDSTNWVRIAPNGARAFESTD